MDNHISRLENSSRPLIFMSASGRRENENFDISGGILFFPIYANNFCDAGQVPTLRYFEACFCYGVTHWVCSNLCGIY